MDTFPHNRVRNVPTFQLFTQHYCAATTVLNESLYLEVGLLQ